jgi:hypothetical protein
MGCNLISSILSHFRIWQLYNKLVESVATVTGLHIDFLMVQGVASHSDHMDSVIELLLEYSYLKQNFMILATNESLYVSLLMILRPAVPG